VTSDAEREEAELEAVRAAFARAARDTLERIDRKVAGARGR